MKKYILTIAFSFIVGALFSQTKVFNDSLDVNAQFDFLIKKSSRWQEYKVVKNTWLFKLKNNVNDSIDKYKKKNAISKKEINSQKEVIKNLTLSNQEGKATIKELNATKNSVLFLGIEVSKSVFKTILYLIIALLALFLAFFIYKFKESNAITRETISKLSEAENEHEDYRRRALEREQKVMRKLQDEINKQKKN